jgi:hypothetical protein
VYGITMNNTEFYLYFICYFTTICLLCYNLNNFVMDSNDKPTSFIGFQVILE